MSSTSCRDLLHPPQLSNPLQIHHGGQSEVCGLSDLRKDPWCVCESNRDSIGSSISRRAAGDRSGMAAMVKTQIHLEMLQT